MEGVLTLALPTHPAEPAPEAYPLVNRAWSRARALGVDPDSPAHPIGIGHADLLTRRDRLADAFAARSPLNLVPSAIAAAGEAGFIALLTDTDGVILSAHTSPRFDNTASRVRLVEGAAWSEDARGTNAIGTALFEGQPVAVIGGAHFERENKGLVCYAAPIRDPRGEIVAVFDVTSYVELASPLVGALVTTVAQTLEQVLREHAFARAHPGGLGALRALVERARGPAFLVEKGGACVASRELGLRPPGWPEIERALMTSTPLEHAGHRFTLEPVCDARGDVLAAVALPAARPLSGRHPRPALHGAPSRAAEPASFAPIAGSDPALLTAKRLAQRFAPTTLPVLLLAETGTGKELFARAIHEASPRARGPFVAVNCGAIAPTLLESELFGYAPGAFTGAHPKGAPGRIGAAAGGTLFLDEVGELSLSAQSVLLRVLEDGSYQRLGEALVRKADVRVLCATHRDLGAMVADGSFRRDLYYRIRGAVLTLPPLRERADLAELCDTLLARLVRAHGLPPATLSATAMEALARHAWPGNVRELKMTLEVALVLAEDGSIEVEHLPAELAESSTRGQDTPPEATPSEPSEPVTLRAEAERQALQSALAQAGGNLSRAAELLGVARTTLYRMMRRHGIERAS